MPAVHLDALNDPLLVDSCPGFAGGQRSYGPPDQLQPAEAYRLVNMDIGDGTATTRRGTETLGEALPGAIQGLCWYDTPAHEYLVAAANGALWKWDETAWAGFSIYAADVTAPIRFAQLLDALYIAAAGAHLHAWDGATLTDLGTGGAAQPPLGNILIGAQNRLWLAGIAAMPDALHASHLSDGATWDAAHLMIRVGAGEGDPITGLAEWDDYQIVVFKRNSIYVVRADPATTSGIDAAHALSNATVTKISDALGCVAPGLIARVGSDLWFLSDAGVFTIGRVLAQTQREVKEAASLPVHDVIERIQRGLASQAIGIYWKHRYLLSLPLDDESGPGTVLVYHTQRECWSGLWTGWAPRCWAASKAAGQERLNFGRADGEMRRWLDYVPAGNEVESTYQDAGAHLPSSVETRATTFREPASPKSALSLQVEFFGSRATAAVAVQLDQNEPVILRQEVATDPGTLLLAFDLPALLPGHGVKRRAFGAQHLPPFRSLQAAISAPAGKLSVRGVVVSGFVNSVVLEE